MIQPLVSVVVPNYNYERYLAEAIDSVLAQQYDAVECVFRGIVNADSSRR